MFVQDDEFILLMEDQNGGRYTVDDLKLLRDVGIQTIIRYPSWKDIEVSRGEYVWDAIDESIWMTRSAGMKCLFAVYDKAPEYFPPDWYLKAPDGSLYSGPYQERLISPWSSYGWEHHMDFLKKFCGRVSARDVMCFRATTHGAESMLPQYSPCRFDGPYWETIRWMLLREQEIFYEAHPSHELWTCFHHAFDYLGTTGTEYARDLYSEMANTFSSFRHYCISYTQFRDDVIGEDSNRRDMQELGLQMFGGSEYADGLIINTSKAIEQGFRGFVSAPLHFYTGKKALEPWMLDAVKGSMDKWRSARGIH